MARAPRTKADDEAEVPEADRLGAFPHPRLTGRLFGHVEAAAELGSAIASGTCHHAWLLVGPRGVGKATLAYRVARYAMANAGARGAPDTLEVSGGGVLDAQLRALSHPGLMLIRRPYDLKDKRFRAVITVDEVRRLRAFLGHTAGDGGWRVVIIDPVDELNGPAANALLKTLEEPPPRTLFLLICSEPGKLLATVRSRCRVLTLAPLSDDDVRSASEAAAQAADVALPTGGELEALVHAAEGRPGRLLALAGEGGAALVTAINGLFQRLPRVEWSAVHALADDVGTSRPPFPIPMAHRI
jgi:DNA polymerase-3 subunit delta'